jgi:hypothetical protein
MFVSVLYADELTQQRSGKFSALRRLRSNGVIEREIER